MKRIITMLLVVTLLVGLMPLGAASAETYATVYSGNQYGVRLREGPSTTYTQMTIIPSGTTIIVLESGGLWTKIQAGTTIGYMMSKYLVTGAADPGTEVKGTATVTSGNGLRVWLRTAANGKRIGLYSVGTPVSILEYGETWCKVMIGSSVGYMMTQFLLVPKEPEPPVVVEEKLQTMSINYPYPIVGDVLKPVVTPTTAVYTCQWEVMDDAGAVKFTSTSPALTVLSSYLNMRIKLTVNGTGNSAGVTLTDTSAQVANTKAITGVLINNSKKVTPIVGDVLTAVIAPSSATVTYSWRVGGTEKSTAGSYTVTSADAGKQIQVYVVGTGNYTGSANSLLTERVASASEIVEVKLSTDYPVIGGTVSAVVRPTGASVSYQWTSGGVTVGTGASYTCVAADLGKQLQVTVKGTGTYTGTATSALSDYVARNLVTGVTLNNTTPAVDETIKATVTPAGANATFEWYSYDSVGATVRLASGVSNTYKVTDSAKGKSIYVVAQGTGTYGGQVTSAKTSIITDYTTITGVQINQTNPVVGDTITATLTPNSAITDNGNVYLWYAGTALAAITTEAKYTVVSQDWNYPIYVQVHGGGTNTGSVRSAYTSNVTNTKALSGVSFQVEDPDSGTGFVGLSGAPLVNQTLKAVVNPNEAGDQVNYVWTVSGSTTSVGAGQTLKVQEAWKGRSISVTVKGQDAAKYTGTVSATTAAVPNTANNLALDLGATILPVAGKMPVTYIEGAKIGNTNTRTYTATITWAEPLDIDGTFLAGQDYTAKVVFTPHSNYSLLSVKTDIDSVGATADMNVAGNIARYTFTTSGSKLINLFNITGLNAPSVGGTPDVSINATNQFTGAVTWHETEADAKAGSNAVGTFKAGVLYYARIKLNAVAPYLLPDKEADKPTIIVAGARSTSYLYGTADQGHVIASFNTVSSETKASLTASRATVPVGSSEKKVQMTAYLSNYSGEQDSIQWEWTVNGQTVSDTFIDKNGTLTIGVNEPAPNTLTVTAKVTFGSVTYSASANIALVAEAAGDIVADNVTVQFIKAPSTVSVTPGSTATASFVAMALNANDEDVTWKVANKTDSNTTIANGVLTIGANETAGTLAITATAIANRQKSATVYLTIHYTTAQPLPASVNFVKKWATMTPGSSQQFEATCSDSSATITYMVSNGATVDKTSGMVTINANTLPDEIIAVSAIATVTKSGVQTEYTATTTIKVIASSSPLTLAEATVLRSAADANRTAATNALNSVMAATPLLADLKTTQGAAETALSTAKANLTAANTDLTNAKNALAASPLAAGLAAAQKELADANTALATAQTAQTQASAKLNDANFAKDQADQALATANGNKATADSALATAEAALTTANANVTTANGNVTTAESKVTSMKTAQTNAKTAWDAAKADPSKTPADIADAESKYRNATNDVAKAESELNAARTAVSTSEATANAAKTQVNNAMAAVVAAGDKVYSAQSAVDTANSAVSTANANLTTANTALTNAQTAVNNAQAKVTAAESSLGVLAKDVSDAEAAVKKAEGEIIDKQVALDAANTAVTDKEAAIAKAEEAKQQAEAAYNAADKVYKDLGGK